MLTIRLQRSGKRNRPDFRIIVAEKASAVQKKFLEILGNYNPRTKVLAIKNNDRLKYWISQHVAFSPTVHNLFVTNKIIEGNKVHAFTIPKKPATVSESASSPAENVQEKLADSTETANAEETQEIPMESNAVATEAVETKAE